MIAASKTIPALHESRAPTPIEPRRLSTHLKYRFEREQLDECVLATQSALRQHYSGKVAPAFCVFNGGQDVWVDMGNKLIGVAVLQRLLGAVPQNTLHLGDQFLATGNDIATRSACCTVWVISPEKTETALDELLLQHSK